METMNVRIVPKHIDHKEIQERLGDKLCFVFRNFPITNIRPHAYETALAAEAAAAQGKFWDMYDSLFKHGQMD